MNVRLIWRKHHVFRYCCDITIKLLITLSMIKTFDQWIFVVKHFIFVNYNLFDRICSSDQSLFHLLNLDLLIKSWDWSCKSCCEERYRDDQTVFKEKYITIFMKMWLTRSLYCKLRVKINEKLYINYWNMTSRRRSRTSTNEWRYIKQR